MGITVDIIRKLPGESDEAAVERIYDGVPEASWHDGDQWVEAVDAALGRFHDDWTDHTRPSDRGRVLIAHGIQFELAPNSFTVRLHRHPDETFLWACCEALRREFGTATAINADDLQVIDPAAELGPALAEYEDRLPPDPST